MKSHFTRYDLRLSRAALPLIVAVRWRLWRTPFPVLHAQWRAEVQGALDAALSDPARAAALQQPLDTDELYHVWHSGHAVRRMARLVPFASCLTQAMALQMLLARSGHLCSVHIGVERRRTVPDPAAEVVGLAAQANPLANGSDIADGRFRAHAWVEWHGRVIIGGDIRGWKPLTIFAPVAAPSVATSAPVATPTP